MTSVAICIPTYRRPAALRRLLESLAPELDGSHDATVIVVDNDSEGSAEEVTREFEKRIPRLIYAVEPAKGLAAVRNHLSILARASPAEYIVFVDDDEWVQPGWLGHLLQTRIRFDADIVAGPVLPVISAEAPVWIRNSTLFDRPRYRTGERPARLGLGNVLVKPSCLAMFDPPFDRRFDRSGGEDAHLLMRLLATGAVMVWCDDAPVFEEVSAGRATWRWLMRRAYRSGAVFTVIDAELHPGRRARLLRLARALASSGVGLAQLPAGLLRGRRGLLQAACRCARGAGGVRGFIDMGFSDYA
jgi:succinoglycan biosynthesis protein ExoM